MPKTVGSGRSVVAPAGASPTEGLADGCARLDAQSWLRRGRPDGGPIPSALGAGCSVAAPPGRARRRPSAQPARFWTLRRGPAGTSPTEAFCARRRGSGRSVVAPPGQARRRPDAERARCWMLSRGSAGAGPTEPFCAAGAVLDAQSWPRRDKPDGGPIPSALGAGCSVVAPPGQARRRPDPEGARCWMLSRGSAGAGPTEAFCAGGAVLDAQSWPRRGRPDGGLLRGRRGSGRSVVAPPGQA